MRLQDFFQVFIIFLLFAILFFYNMYSVGIKKIKDNWPEHRCKPSVMPFASFFGFNASDNFNDCMNTMQTDYMGILMEPVNYTLSSVADGAGMITDDLQNMRGMFSNVRSSVGDGFSSIYGTFLNVMRAFQKLIMKMKDTVNKLISVVFVVMYFMLAAKDSLLAIVDGPVGSVISVLGGGTESFTMMGNKNVESFRGIDDFGEVCFHPNTLLMKKDKTLVKMKDIKLDDVLINGSKVKAVLQIRNHKKNDARYSPLYKIHCTKLNTDILVTGSHLIQHPRTKQFIPVQDYNKAIPTDTETEDLSCLITDDHLIQIGEITFWDWED